MRVRGSIFQKYDKKIRKFWKNIEILKFNYRIILKRYEKADCGKWKAGYNPTKNERLPFFDFRIPWRLKSTLKLSNILYFSKNTIFAYFVMSEIKDRNRYNSNNYYTCREEHILCGNILSLVQYGPIVGPEQWDGGKRCKNH